MGPLAAFLLTQVPGLIKTAKEIFKDKPESGHDKMDMVVRAAQQIIASIIQAKVTLPDGSHVTTQPPIELLQGFIEGVYQDMKVKGALETPKAQYYLVQAVSVTPLPII